MKFSKLIFCGHSAVFLESESMTVAIDPWLEGNPSCPDHLKSPPKLDLIVLTHGHSDHAGDIVRLMRNSSAQLVATYELAMAIIGEGIPSSRVVPMNKGGTVSLEGVEITLTHAMHSNSYDSSKGTVYAGEACGAIIKDSAQAIYHAGDTALFSDMTLIRDTYKPALGILPIGDRFTMGPREAARAAKLLGIKRAIPIHFNTFPLLTGTADEFEKACKEVEVAVTTLKPGGDFDLTKV